MDLKHTKEEWFLTTDGEANFFGISANKDWLMRIQQNGKLSLTEEEANAKLIAAAPDMLKFIVEISETYPNSEWISGEAKQIIKKATE